MDNKSAFKVKVTLSKTYEYPISVIDKSYLEGDATDKSINDFIIDLESSAERGIREGFFKVNVEKEPIFKFRKKVETEVDSGNKYKLIQALVYDTLESEYGTIDPIKNPDIFEKSSDENRDGITSNVSVYDTEVKKEYSYFLKPKVEDRYYQLIVKYEMLVDKFL